MDVWYMVKAKWFSWVYDTWWKQNGSHGCMIYGESKMVLMGVWYMVKAKWFSWVYDIWWKQNGSHGCMIHGESKMVLMGVWYMVKAKWFSWMYDTWWKQNGSHGYEINKQIEPFYVHHLSGSSSWFKEYTNYDWSIFTAIASDITRRVCECTRCIAVPHVHCVWWHLDVQTDIYLPVPSTLRNR